MIHSAWFANWRTPMRRNAVLAGLSGAVVLVAAACGSPTTSTSSSSPGGLAPANNYFAGKTIRLISSGSAGSNHDLAARAVAPYLGKYLHATVDVVDMPGAGQLLAWNYVDHATPDGLTIGTTDIQGMLANYWEKVPNQTFNLNKLTYLGFMAGGQGGGSKVMFALNASKGPLSSIYALLRDKTTPVKAVGSVGDVTVPLWAKAYGLPLTDLTSYPDANAELQGMLRGDGSMSSKTWGGSWEAATASGTLKVLFANTMHSSWPVDPAIPTVSQILKKDPPSSASARAAIIANSEAEDGGLGLFGPPGIKSNVSSLLAQAVKWAMTQKGFIAAAKKAALDTVYISPAQQLAAIHAGLNPVTVATIRKFVPLSSGVAS